MFEFIKHILGIKSPSLEIFNSWNDVSRIRRIFNFQIICKNNVIATMAREYAIAYLKANKNTALIKWMIEPTFFAGIGPKYILHIDYEADKDYNKQIRQYIAQKTGSNIELK